MRDKELDQLIKRAIELTDDEDTREKYQALFEKDFTPVEVQKVKRLLTQLIQEKEKQANLNRLLKQKQARKKEIERRIQELEAQKAQPSRYLH